MKKSLLFFCLILLGSLAFSRIALASEGECHLKHCLVPAPTILGPEQGSVVKSQRPGIKGLTWKTTIVKVYLDGQELPQVKQVKHWDYYGSFYVEPDYNLAPGVHYVYTIAHSEKPGWYDQSKESIYLYFTVELPTQLILKSKAPSPPLTSKAELEIKSSEITPITKSTTLPQQVGIVEQEEITSTVQVEKGKIEGGVSVEKGSLEEAAEIINQPEKQNQPLPSKQTNSQELNLQGAAGLSDLGEILKDEFINKEVEKKARENRIIGLSLLALIVIFSVIWLVTDKLKFKKEKKQQQEDELPPPPTPPEKKEKNRKTKGSPADNIQEQHLGGDKEKAGTEVPPPPIEPLNSAKNDQDRYFATPPYSPHSPYPSWPKEPDYLPFQEENELFDAEQALREIEGKYTGKGDQEQNKLL